MYEANPGVRVAPASVIKLVTAVAALEVLGEGTRFRTSVRAVSALENSVVAGDVWLVGGGDPLLGTDAWAARAPAERGLYTSLDALATRVAEAGVRRIEGRIVADESRYDSERYISTWPSRLVADGESGPLSALIVNDGFRVWGHPGVPFSDPPREAAALFEELLEARGVEVTGGATVGVASGSVELAAIDSRRVGELVTEMLRESDNETAELLVKEMGVRRYGQGSTVAGIRAATDVLASLRLPVADALIADGSGLSDADRVTCGFLTALLSARSGVLRGRLPVAGRDASLGGALGRGPAAGLLRAKTGSLNHVSGLAGYVENVSGATVTFSYVVNGLPEGSTGGTLREALARVLVESPL